MVIVFSKTFHCRWFIGDLVTGATSFLGSVHTRSLLSSFSPGDLRILALPSEDVSFYADACGGCYPKRSVPVWLAYLFAWFKELTTPKGKEVLVSRNRIRRFTNTRLLDTTKIETELGFTPEHTDAKTVISEAVRWLIDNGYLPLTS